MLKLSTNEVVHTIRVIAMDCKNKNTMSVEFGNEFHDRVEKYLGQLDYIQQQYDDVRANNKILLMELEKYEDMEENNCENHFISLY